LAFARISLYDASADDGLARAVVAENQKVKSQ
jgi:hypothetical protein